MEDEGWTFHDEIEVPSNHSVHLALSMPATIDDGSTHLRLGVTVQPLLAQHGDERGEKGSSQTRVKDGLNVDNGRIWAIPHGEFGGVTSGGIPKRSAGDDLEEGKAHLRVIGLKILLNVDDENRRNYGEQAGLFPRRSRLTTG